MSAFGAAAGALAAAGAAAGAGAAAAAGAAVAVSGAGVDMLKECVCENIIRVNCEHWTVGWLDSSAAGCRALDYPYALRHSPTRHPLTLLSHSTHCSCSSCITRTLLLLN